MSFFRYRLAAGALAAGPLLFVMIGCSGGTPAEGTSQAAAAAAATPTKPEANAANPAGAASFDRYANPAPTTPAAKPAVDFDGEAFKSAVANQAVVGDRYSR
jgi:hypothetical protein